MKLLSLYMLWDLFVLISCKKSSVNRSASDAIQGSYTANIYTNGRIILTYPINGKTFMMKIVHISEDSVEVTINSTANGFYSPGDTVINLKTAVETISCRSCQYPVTYQFALGALRLPGTLENVIWFDPSNNAYYTYVPKGYTQGAVQTIMTKR